jgi:hypothetical protein
MFTPHSCTVNPGWGRKLACPLNQTRAEQVVVSYYSYNSPGMAQSCDSSLRLVLQPRQAPASLLSDQLRALNQDTGIQATLPVCIASVPSTPSKAAGFVGRLYSQSTCSRGQAHL